MERSAFILGVKHSLTVLGALGFEDEATSCAKRQLCTKRHGVNIPAYQQYYRANLVSYG